MKNREKELTVALTIAGFDPGGGAGIIADIKTFSALNVYGTSVISSITSQNHKEFFDIADINPSMFGSQLEAVFSGYGIKAVKTGLLPFNLTESLVMFLKDHKHIPVVADPVFSSTTGKIFIDKTSINKIMDKFLPFTSLVTPNLKEASLLSGMVVKTGDDMITAGRKLYKELKVPVLIKGGHLAPSGHLEEKAADILFDKNGEELFGSEFIGGVDTHGSGCILSAAITAFLAKGFELKNSVRKAKDFLDGLLSNPAGLEKAGVILDPILKYPD